MKREEFEKRMAGIFDLSAYVDSQGDIRYSDSHTQAAWDGCQLVVDLFEPAPSVRQGMSLDHIGRLHALEKRGCAEFCVTGVRVTAAAGGLRS